MLGKTNKIHDFEFLKIWGDNLNFRFRIKTGKTLANSTNFSKQNDFHIINHFQLVQWSSFHECLSYVR